jgi:hypothetical protein
VQSKTLNVLLQSRMLRAAVNDLAKEDVHDDLTQLR